MCGAWRISCRFIVRLVLVVNCGRLVCDFICCRLGVGGEKGIMLSEFVGVGENWDIDSAGSI